VITEEQFSIRFHRKKTATPATSQHCNFNPSTEELMDDHRHPSA